MTLLWLKKVRTPIQPIWDRSHRSLSHPLHFPAGFFDAAAQDVNVAVVYGFMWTRVVNTRYIGMALQAQTWELKSWLSGDFFGSPDNCPLTPYLYMRTHRYLLKVCRLTLSFPLLILVLGFLRLISSEGHPLQSLSSIFSERKIGLQTHCQRRGSLKTLDICITHSWRQIPSVPRVLSPSHSSIILLFIFWFVILSTGHAPHFVWLTDWDISFLTCLHTEALVDLTKTMADMYPYLTFFLLLSLLENLCNIFIQRHFLNICTGTLNKAAFFSSEKNEPVHIALCCSDIIYDILAMQPTREHLGFTN